MSKKCLRCKKEEPTERFIQNEKEYSTCNTCRIERISNKNICEKCGIRASFNIEGEKRGIRCVSHKDPNMIDVKHVLCIICKKTRPSYNYKNEKKALYCVTCKDATMVDVTRILCKKCDIKIPTFNYKGEKKAIYCADCKESNMVDVLNRKCEKCKLKVPLFNFDGEKIGKYCGMCKDIDMIDVVSIKCKQCNKTQPSFNYENESNPLYCKKCKKPEMVDVIGKKCETCKKKTPVFNHQGNKAKYCNDCKETCMINVTDRKCEKCNIKQPTFNYEGSKPKYCMDCKEIDMIDVLNRKCEKCAEKIPMFNYENEKKGKYCNDCKEPNMVDVVNKKCKECSCRRRAYYAYPGVIPEYCMIHKKEGMMKHSRRTCCGSATEKCKEIATHGIEDPLHCEKHVLDDEYNLAERTCSTCKRIDILNKNGICVNFCSHEEKDQIIKKNIKRREEFIGKLLNEEIEVQCSYQNQIIDPNCSKKRPDFVYHCGTHIVIIEVDEHQHKSYKCIIYGDDKEGRMKGETVRMFDIAQSFDGLPVIFLRYNPDDFKYNDDKKTNITNPKRHQLLISWIKYCLKTSWTSGLYVKYLFYDGYEQTDDTFKLICEKDVL